MQTKNACCLDMNESDKTHFECVIANK